MRGQTYPRGIMLITSLFVVVLVTMLVVAAVKLSSGSLRAVSQMDERELALWAANSGLEYAQTRLQADFSWRGNLGGGVETVIDQPGLLRVVEDNGNVVGVLQRENGGVAQFLIRFNPQDGSNDPAYFIKNPHISFNNLHRETPNPVYLGNGSGWAQTTSTNHDCPPRTAAVIVEGRAGSALPTDPLNPDPPASATTVSRVAEGYFSPDGSDVLSGLMFGGADIAFGPTASKNTKVNLDSLDSELPNIQTGGDIEASGGSGEIKSKVGARLSLDQGAGNSVNAKTAKNISVTNNNGTLTFPEIEWDTLPHADGSETSIPSGLYVWRNEGGGNKGLYYYDDTYENYESGAFVLPAIAPGDRVNETFTGLPGATGSGLSYDATSGQITVTQDVLVTGSRSIAVISEDDGNSDRTFNFAPPEGESAVFTNAGGDVVLDATVKGTGGTITSAGEIQLTGAGYNLFNEPTAVTGLSLYAKGDIFLQTFEAPPGTPKGSTKSKNSKGKPEVKSGAAGKFFDMKLTGVIYTWGDFTADLGGKAKLEMKGALVAYGSDPSVGPPVPGQGFVTMDAEDINLVYDSRYLAAMLQNTSGPLKRTLWVIY